MPCRLSGGSELSLIPYVPLQARLWARGYILISGNCHLSFLFFLGVISEPPAWDTSPYNTTANYCVPNTQSPLL